MQLNELEQSLLGDLAAGFGTDSGQDEPAEMSAAVDQQPAEVSDVNEIEEITYPVYYIDLDDTQYSDVRNNVRDVFLKMDFPNRDRKRADIYINGELLNLDTSSNDYDKDISGYVERGENELEIRPKIEFAVDMLVVKLEEV